MLPGGACVTAASPGRICRGRHSWCAAGLEDPPDPAWQAQTSIQVYQNLLALLNELSDDTALAPQINNPNRDDLLPGAMKPAGLSFRPGLNPEDIEANLREARENYKFAKAWMYILSGMTMPREYMYGPVYNIESWFGGGDQYICGGLRRKIINWLENRRFKRKDEAAANAIDRLEKMNGLDFGYYAIVPAHVWAGIFPAGADRFAEYRALDPWWTQAWPDEWRQPENLMTQADEDAHGAIYRAFNYYLVYVVISYAPALTVGQAISVVQAWLNGEPPERIQAIIDNSGFLAWYSQLHVDDDNVDANGRYLMGAGVEEWFKALIKDLG